LAWAFVNGVLASAHLGALILFTTAGVPADLPQDIHALVNASATRSPASWRSAVPAATALRQAAHATMILALVALGTGARTASFSDPIQEGGRAARVRRLA
jgi:hypothetical protein